MSKFDEKLRKMQEKWNESEDTADALFSDIPEGVYLGELQSAGLDESSNGNLMIKREHLISQGDFEGRVAFDNMVLSTEYGFAFVRRWMNTMGYECPENVSEIPDILEEMVNYQDLLQFKVSHDGDFTNVRILEIVERGEYIGETEESEPEVEEEPEPKTASQEITEKKLDNMLKDDLKSLIKVRKFDIDLGLNKKPMLQKIKEEMGFIKTGKSKKKSKKKKKKSSGKDWKQNLEDFCIAQDLPSELDDDEDLDGKVLDSEDNMKDSVSFFEYYKDELTGDEIKVLEHYGLEDLII